MTSRRVVAVLRGGRSSEHDISLASAASVIAALDPARYDVRPVDIGRDGAWRWADGEAVRLDLGGGRPLGDVEVVIPMLHGPFGEDGTVQGLLEMAGLPYVGSGVAGCAVTMDKDLTKAVLRDAGVPVARSLTLLAGDADATPATVAGRVPDDLGGWPVFVKPARLGSSVGITRVADADGLADALRLAFAHDPKVLVEEGIAGVEVECGVLGNDAPVASRVGRIAVLTGGGWYDYTSKYAPGGSDLVVPADIPAEAEERVRSIALRAFAACGCTGMARIDVFLRPGGEVVCNEVNAIPGFTQTSYYARLFEASGVGYADLLDRLVTLALERHAAERAVAW